MKRLFKKNFAILLSLTIAAANLVACNNSTAVKETTAAATTDNKTAAETANDDAKIKVMTTIYPLQYLAETIGGDKVEVTNLMPGGMDPHDWEPSAQDMAKLAEANAVIYNGAGLEAWLEAAQKTLQEQNVNFIDASAGLEFLHGGHHHHHHHDGEAAHEHEHEHDGEAAHEHEHEHDGEAAHEHEHEHDHDSEAAHEHEHEHEHENEGFDPHVWTNPLMFSQMAENVAKAFSNLQPANKDYFATNLQNLQTELQKLDAEYAQTLAQVKNKTFLVSHGAFQYMAKQYGLVQTTVTEGEHHDPSPAAMQELIDKAKAEGIKAVYYDVMDNDKVAKTIAEAIGGQAYPISTLENRAEEQQNKDYFAIMRDNLAVLAEGLNK